MEGIRISNRAGAGGHPRSPGESREWAGQLPLERILTSLIPGFLSGNTIKAMRRAGQLPVECLLESEIPGFLSGHTIKAMRRSRSSWRRQASGRLSPCRFCSTPVGIMSRPHSCFSLSACPVPVNRTLSYMSGNVRNPVVKVQGACRDKSNLVCCSLKGVCVRE